MPDFEHKFITVSSCLTGSRPGSAPRGPSKGPHELYSQTLQEAHSQQPQRPRSAQLPRREKLQEELRAQLLVPASQWSVLQVSNWVSGLRLPQYRKRFIHQGVNGSLLLKLNHSILKVIKPSLLLIWLMNLCVDVR